MTKHRKHRRTRRSQKGGGILDFFGFGSSTEPPVVEETGLISNLSDSVSGATSNIVSGASNVVSGAENILSSSVEKAKGAVSSSGSWFSSLNPFSSAEQTQTTTYNPQPTMGGKRRRKSRKMRGAKYMKGGKGDLGLTYYATDVSNDGLKVVEPTYWIKGGSKRRRRSHNYRHKTHRKK